MAEVEVIEAIVLHHIYIFAKIGMLSNNHTLKEGSDIMKICIFNDKKNCNNCGECDVCEYNKNKQCDNCSKCLQLEGYDVKAIKIDEVFEKLPNTKNDNINIEDFSEFDVNDNDDSNNEDSLDDIIDDYDKEEYIDALDDENNWEYIDDLEGIKDLLEDGDSLTELGLEKYPGLIVINPQK